MNYFVGEIQKAFQFLILINSRRMIIFARLKKIIP